MTESEPIYQVSDGVDDLTDLFITADTIKIFCVLHPDVNPDNGQVKEFAERVEKLVLEHMKLKSKYEALKETK